MPDTLNGVNCNTESKIKKVLYNEFTLAIAAVSLISSFIFWITNPQNAMKIEIVELRAQVESNQTVVAALQQIKENDLHEFQLRLDQIDARQLEIIKALARLEAVH